MNEALREQFPSLRRQYNGRALVYLDGPAGTQVPQMVINSISDYYKTSNANTHGHFITTHETDEMMQTVRKKVANFLNAESPYCISFGQNMTTLNYSLSSAIEKTLLPGDEILITQLDHEANRGPWINMRKSGITVREINIDERGNLDYSDLEKKINEKTRYVAVGLASNIFGTVNDISLIRNLTYQVGAQLIIDAVHYAPHFKVDVHHLGCDYLLCSAYKFYGPHVGILYSKPGKLDSLPTNRLRTQDQKAPYKIETGTLNHPAMAGVGASIDFISQWGDGNSEREKITSAMDTFHQHESGLALRLYQGLKGFDRVDVIGPSFKEERAPTISFTIDGATPEELCKYLGEKSVLAWDGHFYAIRATEVLGLLEKGGVTRMGIVAYNTSEEVDYTLNCISDFIGTI